jgi:hypothetical protein
MKKLIAALLCAVPLFVAGPVMADDVPGAYFEVCGISFTYPLANTNAVALYDFWAGQGLLGAETRLATFPSCAYIVCGVPVPARILNVNFGATTSGNADGMPFVSLDCSIARVGDSTNIGIAGGRDFKRAENHLMLKASMPFWGM